MHVFEPQLCQPHGTSMSTVTSPLVAQHGTHINPLVSITSDLGTNVPLTTQEKIWNNEYIDLAKLLHLDPAAETQQLLVLEDGQIKITSKLKDKKKASISEWTDAYLTTCRIYELMSGVSKLYHFIRLTREIHSDPQIWLKFLNEFNGTTKFSDLHWESDKNVHFYSDSSGSVGCGVIFGSSWSYLCWPEEWNMDMRNDITFLEFVPIVLGFYMWSDKLQNMKLILHVENTLLPVRLQGDCVFILLVL